MPVTEVPVGAIVATLLGFAAAGIVIATTFDIPLPLISSERRALLAVVGIGLAMCVVGGWSTQRAIQTSPTMAVAIVAGALSILVVFAVINGWNAVLDPIAGVLFGRDSYGIADRVGVLALGVLIGISWIASTLRQVGLIAAG